MRGPAPLGGHGREMTRRADKVPPRVPELRVHDHQPHRRLVRDVVAPLRTDLHLREHAPRGSLRRQPPKDLRPRLLRPVLQPVGVLTGHLLHGRRGRVPVPRPLRVEIRRLIR